MPDRINPKAVAIKILALIFSTEIRAARTKIAIAIMARASDKARFYLEQSVPELQEFERKKVFTKVRVLLCLMTISRANFISRKKSVQSRKKGPTSNTPSTLEVHILQITHAMQNSK